ncbi:MAG: redoxin domain-containing protein [Bacteroides sp.]
MKKSFVMLAAAALMAACGGAPKGYTVSGTVEGAQDGETVYLRIREGRQMVNVDSAVIANGKFTFKGQQDTARSIQLLYPGQEAGKGLSLNFYLENGQISIALTQSNDKVTGSPLNDRYQPYREQFAALDAEKKELLEQANDTTLSEEQMHIIREKFYACMERSDSLEKVIMNENITNLIGVELLKSTYYALDLAELEALVPQIPAEYQSDERVVRIQEMVVKMRVTAVGQKFTDFTMQDPEGKEVKLSDYVGKGKVVLIDFWASWCGPCRREMPNLVEAYKQYKGKNFEIVGVSLDRDLESWKKGIADLNITWPQMSDLKYWDCEGAKLYAVSSIPHTLLVDGEGTIVARGLHGEELQQKIAELMK